VKRLADALYCLLLTLWVGGLWAIGYLVAPTLFATLADRQMAGLIAGKLFALIGWIGLGASAYLLPFMALRSGAAVLRQSGFWLVLLMLAGTAAGLFGIQPLMAQLKLDAAPLDVMDSVLRDRFVFWHGVSSVSYLAQSLFGALLVLGTCRAHK
jgi:hypothetical protein